MLLLRTAIAIVSVIFFTMHRWTGSMIAQPIQALLGLYVLVAAADGPPTVNIENTCRQMEKTVSDLLGGNTFGNCVSAQQEARAQLIENWAKYPTEDKRCVNATGFMPNYVEWLTCFEMAERVRNLRKEQPAPSSKANPRARN